MAHFAELGENNVVLRVIVVDNRDTMTPQGEEREEIGVAFCRNLLGGTWKQTSYNGNFRKNYAGIGFTYDAVLDAFIAPKPYLSWLLNTETCQWQAPTPYPSDGNVYTWNEETLSWVQVNV